MLLFGIILWLEVNIQFTQCFLSSATLLILFKILIYAMLANEGRFISYPNVSTVMHLDSGIAKAITPTTLFSSFFFYSTYLDACLIFAESETVPAHSIGGSDWHLPKTVPYFWLLLNRYDLHLLCCLPPILTTLLVYRPILLLILIVLVRSCICFKMIQLIFSLLAFCLLMLNPVNFFEFKLGRQRKLPLRENTTSNNNSITSCKSNFQYTPLLYLSPSRVVSRLPIVLYYNRF